MKRHTLEILQIIKELKEDADIIAQHVEDYEQIREQKRQLEYELNLLKQAIKDKSEIDRKINQILYRNIEQLRKLYPDKEIMLYVSTGPGQAQIFPLDKPIEENSKG